MKELVTKFISVFSLAAGALTALSIQAADYPAPKEADWVARDFRFHTGDVLPEERLHYTTVGAPSGEPVLLLHRTAGRGAPRGSGRFPRASPRRGPSRSVRAATSSSCPMPSARENRPALPMACARA